ncbi:MAG TPA: beta-xylosidase [Terracidiphilus sp.]|nr:beta-xylosidase [Terracidiphilus sp.]
MPQSLTVFAAALLAAAVPASRPATPAPAPRQITADVAQVVGPRSQVPLMCVGAGRANEGLRADWQKQLALVQKEIGFHYIRFHGLLDDDMGVYKEDAAGNPRYNFQYIDSLYDALLALHIRPFVELSFMPDALASGSNTVFWYKGNITPPKSMEKWQGLIRALISHWKQRYGEEEISKWYFEVWNEPDLKIFFTGSREQYFQLYAATATAIRSVCPQCRVGGPASATEPMVKDFLQYVASHHVPVDFISTHVYATKSGFVDAAKGTVSTIFDTSPDAIIGHMRESREDIEKSPLPHLPLHYTEWGSSWTSVDPLHDQYLQASFILDKVRKASPFVNSMSWWTFTDIFEERGPRFTPFYGGFGLLNYESIRKPSFFAYQFLSRLGKSDVATTDSAPGGPRSWITRTGDSEVQALFWDYSPMGPPPGQDDQTFFKKVIPTAPTSPVQLTLTHLKSGRYQLKVYRVGYEENDAYTAYLHLGAPSQLTRDQVAVLQRDASGAPVEERTVTIGNGTFRQTFPMRKNDVCLVTLTRM